jgi:hypothetical protein
MTSQSNANETPIIETPISTVNKPPSEDVGWRYGNTADGVNRIRCFFCQKVVGSGVNRLKHIAGVSFNHVNLGFRVDDDDIESNVDDEEETEVGGSSNDVNVHEAELE